MKWNKIIIFVILIIIIFFELSDQEQIFGENATLRTSDDPEIKVVATTTVLRDFAQNIIGNKGSVSAIVEGGSCPGHYDYSPSDIALVDDADIVFYHIMEWGQFLEALLDAVDNKAAAYSLNGNNATISVPWGAPPNAYLYIDAICAHLNNTYPELNQTFNQNSATYKQQIAEKQTEIEELNNNSYNFAGTKAYIMTHQTGFVTWLGFDVTGSWSVADSDATPSDLTGIINGASATGAEIIIMNYQSGIEMGQEAADELGIPCVPLLNFPGVYGVSTYLEQLDFNIALLNWALNDGPDPRIIGSVGLNLLIPLMTFMLAGVVILIYKKRHSEQSIN